MTMMRSLNLGISNRLEKLEDGPGVRLGQHS